MFVIINGDFVIFVSVCSCGLSEIEEIKILEEEMQQQRNITKQTIYSPYDATTMHIHNFNIFVLPPMWRWRVWCTNYSPLPMILTTKNVSRKKWRGAKWTDFWMAKKPHKLAIPSWWKKRGNDCDVAVGNCVYGCFSPCSRSLRGDEGRGRDGVDGMGDGRRAGNSGREILFLAALTWAPTLKVAPFFLRIFSLPYYHSMVELCYLLNPTLFFCSPYKIPMRK